MVETIAPGRQLLTIQQTAERLSISETTVRRLIGAGILPAVRISAGAIRIERDELADWINERRTAESTVGSGSFAETAMGRGSSVETPAERDGTSSSREAVEPAQLAGER
jgi:excisionase family DNA binding protein